MCVYVYVCVLQSLSVLSEPGAIGALARARIVLCSLKGQWGDVVSLVPSGPDFPLCCSLPDLSRLAAWAGAGRELESIPAGSGWVEGDGAQQRRRLLLGSVSFGVLTQVPLERPNYAVESEHECKGDLPATVRSDTSREGAVWSCF